MGTLNEHIDVQVLLNTSSAPKNNFGVGLFLVDDVQIPVDKLYILVTADDFDELDPSSDAYRYAQTYFGQKRRPKNLVIGRWIHEDSLPYWVSGSDVSLAPADYATISDGSLNVDDGTNDEDFTALDFTGVTTMEQIIAIIQAKFDSASTVTGLVASFDLYNRVVVTGATAGLAMTVTDGATGTSMSTVLDYTNSSSVLTTVAKTLQEATTSLQDIGVGFWNINVRGGSPTEYLTFAQWVETQKLFVDFVYTNIDAGVSGGTTDLGAQLQALNLDRSMVIYTEKVLEYPDASANGCILPAQEGTTSYAWEALKSVTDSGSPDPLSPAFRAVLKDKNYNHIEVIEGNTIMYNGLTAGGEEKRIMLGRDWFTFYVQSKILAMQIIQPLNAMDNDSMARLDAILNDAMTEAIRRKIGISTVKYPASVTLPDADDITDEMRASHTFEELEAFSMKINSATNDYVITGVWNQ